MVQNPNWPVTDFAISWAAGPNQSPLQPYWTSVLERTETQFAGQRGTQYELDQVQPGTYKVTLRNDDGVFDADNMASPYAPYVDAYRLFRARLQLSPTANLLTQNQATAGEATALPNSPQVETPWAAGTVPPAWAVFQPFPTTVITNSSSWQGSQIFNTAVPSTAAAPYAACGMQGWSVAPGVQYAFTTHARGIGTTATGSVNVRWLDVNGNTISTTAGATVSISTNTTWTTLTGTGTAPANAAAAVVVINIATATASTAYNLQHDGWDVRKNTATPGYVTPGTWFPLFTGYVERWPQTWAAQGNYGTVALTIVDYFANLANKGLLAPFKADLMALNPSFLYPLEEAGTAYNDLTGNRDPLLQQASGTIGSGIKSGSSVTANDNAPVGYNANALTGAFLGTAGPVVTGTYVNPPSPLNGAFYLPAIGLNYKQTQKALGLPAVGQAWTRIFAFRCGPGNTTDLSVQIAMETLCTDSSGIVIDTRGSADGGTTNTLTATVAYTSASAIQLLFPGITRLMQPGPSVGGGGTPFLDADWHLVALSSSADGKTMQTWADNSAAPITGTMPSAISGTQWSNDYVCAGWEGDFALFTQLPMQMDAVTWQSLYQSWRNAWSTVPGNAETSDERYQRILNWVGYTGPTRLSPGLCKSYGPATDIATTPGQPALALTALENVTETEGGKHFIGADGAVVFQSRADRYNKTPIATFGELDGSGEAPYKTAATDRDPTQVANDIQLTAQYGNALYRQQDAASQLIYGDITFTRVINSIDPNEITSASQFYLQQRKKTLTRVQALPFDPGANPALWPILLSLELGQCVAFNRRPSNAPAVTLTGFVEQIAWTIDDQLKAICTVQVSNTKGRNSFGQYGTKRYAADPGSVKPSAAMTAAQTTVTLVTTGGTPATNQAGAFPFDIVIDSEQITLTAPSGSTSSPQTFTILRGVNGTTPAAHAATATVQIAAPNQFAY